jgi:ATP-dependent RNA helicase DbpA
MTTFDALSLQTPLLRAIEVLGFTSTTPVQEHAVPPMLAGKDVIAQARTGSGKTLAFGLGLLSRVDVRTSPCQGLVLCPTRELADQVAVELRKLARFMPNLRVVTLCGGVPARTQVASLQTTPHVIVGTPGRILDHLARQTIDLSQVKVVVLDEADRMLDMGFADDITEIVNHTPLSRQTHLFSATFPDDIRALSGTFQLDPVTVTVDAATTQVDVEQRYYDVTTEQKLPVLMSLLVELAPSAALVFCHTRNDVRDVTAQLQQRGWSCLALHGELEQRERDEVLMRFENGSVSVLVATDVAARGLDIKGLPVVVSFELPTDKDMHVHRVGRTGRAGERGLALSLVTRVERDRIVAGASSVTWTPLPRLLERPTPLRAAMVTLLIDAGKKDKLRAGDVLGAFTKDAGVNGSAIGKIDIGAERTYVAVAREHAAQILTAMNGKKMKGRAFRLRQLL